VDRFEQYAGPSDPQMKKLELVDWIKNLTAVKAEENNPIRFNSRVRSVEIVIDQNSLRAALSELIDNALEAGATTSPVEISLDCDGDTPIIAITNALPSEPGVKPILSNNITEPFLSTKSDRAGLGLTIAQKAINDVGGRLEVEFSSGDHFAAKLILPSNINGDK
jgi:nitrogen fixation/metabolism regulation signal transduction histidine kinase